MRDIIEKLEKLNVTEAKSPPEVINPTKDSSPADLKAAIKYAKYMKAKMDTDKAKATYDKEIAQLEGWLKKKSVMKEDLADMAQEAEKDHEVQMARSDLYKAAKYSVAIHKMMKDVSEMQGIEGWVASKITKAADYLGSVKHYMEGEMMADVELAVVPVAGDMTDAMSVPQEDIEEVHEKKDVKEDFDSSHPDHPKAQAFASEKDAVMDIIKKHPEEAKKMAMSGDLMTVYDTGLYMDLFDHFAEDMPYGTMKARDGDPVEYIQNELDELGLLDLPNDAIGYGESDVNEEPMNPNFMKQMTKAKGQENTKSQQDMINSIIAKLPRDNAEKGVDGPAKTTPAPNIPMQTRQRIANNTGKDPYGADQTVSLDKEFSKQVAKTNAQNMKNVKKPMTQSKFGMWSKN